MLTQLKQQDVNLWEAWIEYDPFNPAYFGTLYIIGEIRVDQKSQPPVLIKNSYRNDGKELRLQAPPKPPGHGRMEEVLYSEQVKNLDQYTSICIYAGDHLIARFNEIEVLI